MAFTKVEIDTWKPTEENEEIIGVLTSIEENVGENKSKLYHLEVDNKPTAIWGSTVLDTKMTAARVGDLIKIIYLGKGEAQKGRNAPKLFEVYIDYEKRDEKKGPASPIGSETPQA